MALRNPRFLDPGGNPGEAAHWTLTAVTSQLVCGFGTPARGYEDFDHWIWFARRLDDVASVRAFFGAAPSDAFTAWVGGPYLRALPSGSVLAAALGPGDAERWLWTSLVRSWEHVDAELADFGDGPERFDTRWGAAPYERDWSQLASASALFSSGTPYEGFASPW